MYKTDYLIIGQGLAGSLLSHCLLKKGKSIAVLDNKHKGAASAVAAGVINPITGRRFVKSWRMDELLPFAVEMYAELSALTGASYYHPKNVAWLFRELEIENNWMARSGDADLEDYISPNFDKHKYVPTFGAITGGVEFQQAGRTDLALLIKSWKKHLQSQIHYLEAPFDYEQLVIGESIVYQDIQADKIIFCEGAQAMQNPYFNYLPFNPAKGEVLLIEIDDYPLQDKMVKDGVFIVPLEDGRYWVGSSYNRHYEHEAPTNKERAELEAQLKKMLQRPYQVIEHLAAIRPTVKDRKPFLGQHPQFSSLYIFNGLGAKGSYLGPYFAALMADYLEGEGDLEKEVDIKRISISNK
jgi:glycine oxidase